MQVIRWRRHGVSSTACRGLLALIAIVAAEVAVGEVVNGTLGQSRNDTWASGFDDFDRFNDQEINDLVFRQLYELRSQADFEAAIVNLAITLSSRSGSTNEAFDSRRVRSLYKVPGLRDVLLDCSRHYFGLVPRDAAIGLFAELNSSPEFMQAMLVGWSCWSIALFYFPGDPRIDSHAQEYGWLLRIMSKTSEQDSVDCPYPGHFPAQESDPAWRACLFQESPKVVRRAARNLKLSLSEKNLEALAAALSRRDWALRDIVEAIAMYAAQGEPHLAKLKELQRQLPTLERDIDKSDPDRILPGRPMFADAVEKAIAVIETAAIGVPASSYARERSKALSRAVLDFDRYGNLPVNEMVFEGVHSVDPEVVDLTLRAVGLSALDEVRQDQRENAVKRRQFEWVPGLFNALRECALPAVHLPGKISWGPVNGWLVERATFGPPEGWPTNKISDWTTMSLCLTALAVIYPGDSRVAALLLEGLGVNPELAGTYLSLLHIARITTAEADEARLSYLYVSDTEAVRYAALGLGQSQTERGLSALTEQLWRRDEDLLSYIIRAIAAHGAMAEPHLPALRALQEQELSGWVTPTIDRAIQIIETASQAKLPWEVQNQAARGTIPRRSETGETPGWQGARSAHIEHMQATGNVDRAR